MDRATASKAGCHAFESHPDHLMASVKKNIILNGINTLTSVLFPVITFPYAARILLPEGIGAINFLNSIIGYIVLLTSLGIPMYAVREVAKYRDDIARRNTITVEIIILSTLLCLLGYVAVWFLAKFVPQIHEQASIFYVLSLSIVFNSIGVNWFYQAIEDFKFITIRAVIIRVLSALALFVFVHQPSDLMWYAFIVVGSTVGNNFINFIHLRKHLSLKDITVSELNVWQHVSPAFQVFILNLIISLYIQLNSIMLGFMAGETEVGYFTAGTKISHIALTVISSISTVLLPRCAHLVKAGQMEEFVNIIKKSVALILALAFPMTVGMMVLVTPITVVFCGVEFAPASLVLLLNAPVVVSISMTNILGIQVLYPMNKIGLVTWSVAGGAVINLIFNFALIPSMGANGAAIATLLAEFGVFGLQLVLGWKYYPFSLGCMLQWRYMIATALMGCAVWATTFMLEDDWVKLVIGVPVGVVVYLLYLAVTNDPVLREIKQFFRLKSSNPKSTY